MLMFGLQQSSPAWGRPLHAFASVAPCNHKDRNSTPMIEPIFRNMDRLKVAPNELGLGKEEGHTMVPLVVVPHVVWTPWMQFTPQSYSGNPILEMLPGGPGDPPPPSRAVNKGGISSSFNKLIRFSTRSSIDRDTLQNGKESVFPGKQARVATVFPGGNGGVVLGEPEVRPAEGVTPFVLSFK